ncbi:MAG: hypothetical protein AB2L14_25360 [Candidatus Xenobiia bacterium LiM19]
MAANKRKKIQIEHDRVKILELSLTGFTQTEIAVRMKMTRQMVGYELKKIETEWRQQRKDLKDDDINHRLAELKKVKRESWRAWEKSKKPRTTTTLKAGSNTQGVVDEKTEKREYQTGNPDYLKRIEECIQEECKMLGLYAPEQTEEVGKPRIIIQNGKLPEVAEPE